MAKQSEVGSLEIAIPSYGRPDFKARAMVMGNRELPWKVCVRESQAAAYDLPRRFVRAMPDEKVADIGLTRKYILDATKAKCLIVLDDDCLLLSALSDTKPRKTVGNLPDAIKQWQLDHGRVKAAISSPVFTPYYYDAPFDAAPCFGVLGCAVMLDVPALRAAGVNYGSTLEYGAEDAHFMHRVWTKGLTSYRINNVCCHFAQDEATDRYKAAIKQIKTLEGQLAKAHEQLYAAREARRGTRELRQRRQVAFYHGTLGGRQHDGWRQEKELDDLPCWRTNPQYWRLTVGRVARI